MYVCMYVCMYVNDGLIGAPCARRETFRTILTLEPWKSKRVLNGSAGFQNLGANPVKPCFYLLGPTQNQSVCETLWTLTDFQESSGNIV